MFSNDRDLPRCSAIKAGGERCQRIVGKDQQYCYSHDPARSSERRENASKAGAQSHKNSHAADEIGALRARLREISEGVLAGQLTTARGQTVATILGVLLRSYEVERKLREQDELVKRLEAVERAYDREGGNPISSDDTPFGTGGRWLR